MPSLAPVAAARSATSSDTSASSPGTTANVAGAPNSFATTLDPTLGITVLKFFGSSGDVTQSFPSQRQLASYQLYGLDKGAAADTEGGAAAAA